MTSTDGFLASVSATAPDGEEFILSDNTFVSTGVPGEYTVTARNIDEAADFYVSVGSLREGEQAAVPRIHDDRRTWDIELFALPVLSDPTTVISVTTEGDLEVEAAVTDAVGNVLVYPDEVIAGTGTIMVTGASASDRLIVTGISGSGAVRIQAGHSPIADARLRADVRRRRARRREHVRRRTDRHAAGRRRTTQRRRGRRRHTRRQLRRFRGCRVR